MWHTTQVATYHERRGGLDFWTLHAGKSPVGANRDKTGEWEVVLCFTPFKKKEENAIFGSHGNYLVVLLSV